MHGVSLVGVGRLFIRHVRAVGERIGFIVFFWLGFDLLLLLFSEGLDATIVNSWLYFFLKLN